MNKVIIKKIAHNQKEDFAIYDNDGNFKGYYVDETILDNYAKKTNTANENGNSTEETKEMFLREIGAKDLIFVNNPNAQWNEYEIIFDGMKEASKKAKEDNSFSENIGSGELPNKYYVSGNSDFFYYNEESGGYDWAGDIIDAGKRYEEYGVYDTYAEAKEKVDEIINNEISDKPVKDGINCITIEDHLSGEVFIAVFEANPTEGGIMGGKSWNYEFIQHDETEFTKKEMEEKGETFARIKKTAIGEQLQSIAEEVINATHAGIQKAIDSGVEEENAIQNIIDNYLQEHYSDDDTFKDYSEEAMTEFLNTIEKGVKEHLKKAE